MKKTSVCIFITFCLPLLIYSQPLISNLDTHQQTEREQAVSFTKSDII